MNVRQMCCGVTASGRMGRVRFLAAGFGRGGEGGDEGLVRVYDLNVSSRDFLCPWRNFQIFAIMLPLKKKGTLAGEN